MVVLNSKVLKCIFVSTKLPLVCLRQTGQWSVVLLPLKNSGSASITLKVLWLKKGLEFALLAWLFSRIRPRWEPWADMVCCVCCSSSSCQEPVFMPLPAAAAARNTWRQQKQEQYLRWNFENDPGSETIHTGYFLPPLGQCDMVLLTPSRPNRSPSPLPGSIDP